MKKAIYGLAFLIALACVASDLRGGAPEYEDTVRIIYLSPSDVLRKEHYERAILSALFDVQQWYADEAGGFSFNLEREPVEWYQLPHTAAFYGEVPEGEPSLRGDLWFWDSIIADAATLLEGFLDGEGVWILYVDVDPPGFQSPLYMEGLSILTANDLRGLTGEVLVPIDSGDEALFKKIGKRFQPWVGKLAHHIGAAFGLTRLTGDDEEPPNALMNDGYLDYPNAYLGWYPDLYWKDQIAIDYREPTPNFYYTELVNPEFERGFSPWFFYTNGTGGATREKAGYISEYRLDVDIKKAGTNTQLLQRNIELLPNTEYILTFTGYSRFGSDVSVSLSNDAKSYVNYGVNRRFVSFDLEPFWKIFVHRFTTKGFSAPVDNGKLLLWFADNAINGERFCIDDISVVPLVEGQQSQPINPWNFAATAASETEVLLTWDPSSKGYQNLSVLGYFVYRDDELIATVTTNSYFDEGLEAFAHYDYKVVAFNYVGSLSDPSTVSIDMPGPNNLLMNGGFEQYGRYWGLSWSNVTDAAVVGERAAEICLRGLGDELLLHQGNVPIFPNTNYQLTFFAKSSMGDDITVTFEPGFDFKPIDLTTEWQAYTIVFKSPDTSGLIEDAYVAFRVGHNSRPWQCYSFDEIVLKALDESEIPEMDGPSALVSTMISESVVRLTWDPPEYSVGEPNYFVYRNGMEVGEMEETHFIDFALEAGNAYKYEVTCFNILGQESAPSNAVIVNTPNAPIPGANLVTNGEFENGGYRWDGYSVTVYASSVDLFPGSSNDYGGRLYFKWNRRRASLYQFNIPLEKESEYILFFAARSNRVTNDRLLADVNLSINEYFDVDSYGLGAGVEVSVSKEWQVYYMTFKTPSTRVDTFEGDLKFGFRDSFGLAGAYNLDHVVITKKGFIENALAVGP